MNKQIKKIFICGSVDDGKSTLLGRLLYDAGTLYNDQVTKLLDADGNKLHFAKLTDGLKTEIENNITVDVAYRYVSIEDQKFIFVDCPGHLEFTSNMISGASQCDYAIVLIDASNGIQQQTKLHLKICEFLGISNIVIALNKMDLVNYSEHVYDEIFIQLSSLIPDSNFTLIPISALYGINITKNSNDMTWYRGPNLLQGILNIKPSLICQKDNSIFSTQLVYTDNNKTYLHGHVVNGTINKAQNLFYKNKCTISICEIIQSNKYVNFVQQGDSCVLVINDTFQKFKRGQIFSSQSPEATNRLQAKLFIFDKSLLNDDLFLKLLDNTIACKYKLISEENIENNKIYKTNIKTDSFVHVFSGNQASSQLNSFLLINKKNEIFAAGRLFNF